MSAFPQRPRFGVCTTFGPGTEDRRIARPGLISIIDIFDDFLFPVSTKKQTPPISKGQQAMNASNNRNDGDDEFSPRGDNDTDQEDDNPRKRSRTANPHSSSDDQKTGRRYV
jgi:hypothetical protein